MGNKRRDVAKQLQHCVRSETIIAGINLIPAHRRSTTSLFAILDLYLIVVRCSKCAPCTKGTCRTRAGRERGVVVFFQPRGVENNDEHVEK